MSSADRVFEGFLKAQLRAGAALAAQSDRIDLVPLDGASPPHRYIARFNARGLVRSGNDEPRTAEDFVVGIHFHEGYLRQVLPGVVLTWLAPLDIFHPNIRPPLVCLGAIAPGTSVVDLLYRVFEVITFHNVSPREDDALNPRACAWAREHQDRFPTDRRPLKRKRS